MSSAALLERAFELSASGTCRNVAQLERQLKKEGFEGVSAHLAGKSLRKQLGDAIRNPENTAANPRRDSRA